MVTASDTTSSTAVCFRMDELRAASASSSSPSARVERGTARTDPALPQRAHRSPAGMLGPVRTRHPTTAHLLPVLLPPESTEPV
ncbi:hypothetical protein HBB16_11440 [Pseudonocardia sp. MCCB 268]|nr:hypothetical protein [Pseudonocardia cytotoxica]